MVGHPELAPCQEARHTAAGQLESYESSTFSLDFSCCYRCFAASGSVLVARVVAYVLVSLHAVAAVRAAGAEGGAAVPL
jgi:hypothetical protein